MTTYLCFDPILENHIRATLEPLGHEWLGSAEHPEAIKLLLRSKSMREYAEVVLIASVIDGVTVDEFRDHLIAFASSGRKTVFVLVHDPGHRVDLPDSFHRVNVKLNEWLVWLTDLLANGA